MNYWLIKTEPSTFSWDKLETEGTSMWDGVRNYQARNNLRKMQTGDMLLFYHSGKEPVIVGLAKVVKENYPDPTAKEGDWSVVDLSPVRKLNRSISLQEIKGIESLKDMLLLRNSRLSVQSVEPEEFQKIMEMENKKSSL
jgi:predicted RNA-binding protein with PUA-like domain